MSGTLHPNDLLACCEEAVRCAGRYALSNEGRRHEFIKKTIHDVKLKLDVECQSRIEEVIHSVYPDHRILGEEGGEYADTDEPMWIVDPIDGTVNFMHGLPLWCSSVAVRVGGEVVAGAVYMPVLNECFTATRNTGSKLNGNPIQVSGVTRVEDAIVLAGLSKHIGKDPVTLTTFKALSFKAQKIRLMGAAAVDICNIACGRADGYFESAIHLWDVAAAALIVAQAGGRAEILEQMSPVRMRVLCSNGLIHDEMKDIVTAAITGNDA